MSAVFPRLGYKAPPTSDVPDLSLSPQQQQGGWAVREEHIDEISGMVLARVPGGAFHTGSDEFSSLPREQPVHVVSLSEFWRAECKVTPRQWALVMGEESAPLDDQEHPVTGVSWYEAAPFAEELSTPTGLPYRLPTEAEWEYAAREGGRACTWSGISDIWELASYALYRANRGGRSHPVR